MKYIFWDIDGTLLKTGLAGVDALRDAIKCRFGIENFQFSHPLAGMTDSFIFKQTIKDIKGSCNAADAAGLLIHYHQLLEKYLPSHHGSLMPNVKETLQYFPSSRRTIKHVCSLVILGPVPLPNCVITGSHNTSTAVTAPAVS